MPKKAASSASARNFLQSSGLGSSNPFMSGGFGFGSSVVSSDYSFDKTAAQVELMEVEDSDINLCFKKMIKKDSITKLKALEEFKETMIAKNILSDEKKELLSSIFNVWCQTFLRLAIDNDRHVRENLYKVFPIFFPFKKLMTEQIKVVLPKWLLHQYDNCKEVSKISRETFATCFPVHKHKEVLEYCKTEINTEIEFNLNSTVATLSDLKVVGKEEAQSRWERIVSCSLAAVSAVFPLCPLPSAKVITNFIQSKIPEVRKGAYKVALQFLKVNLDEKDLKSWINAGLLEEDHMCIVDAWEFLAAHLSSSGVESFPFELLFDRLKVGAVPFNKISTIFALIPIEKVSILSKFVDSTFTDKQMTVHDGKKWNTAFWECISHVLSNSNERLIVDPIIKIVMLLMRRLIFLPLEIYLSESFANFSSSISRIDVRLLEKLESSIFSEFSKCFGPSEVKLGDAYVHQIILEEQLKFWGYILERIEATLDEQITDKILSKFSLFCNNFPSAVIFENIFKYWGNSVIRSGINLRNESLCKLCHSLLHESMILNDFGLLIEIWNSCIFNGAQNSIVTSVAEGLVDISFTFLIQNQELVILLKKFDADFVTFPEFLRCLIFKKSSSCLNKCQLNTEYASHLENIYSKFMTLFYTDSNDVTTFSCDSFLLAATSLKSEIVYRDIASMIQYLKDNCHVKQSNSKIDRIVYILHNLMCNSELAKLIRYNDVLNLSNYVFILAFNQLHAHFCSKLDVPLHDIVKCVDDHFENHDLCLNLRWVKSDELEVKHEFDESEHAAQNSLIGLVDLVFSALFTSISTSTDIKIESFAIMRDLAIFLNDSLSSGATEIFDTAINWCVLARKLVSCSKLFTFDQQKELFCSLIPINFLQNRTAFNFRQLSSIRFCLFMLFDSIHSDITHFISFNFAAIFFCLRLDFLLQRSPFLDQYDINIDIFTDMKKINGLYGATSLTLDNSAPNFSLHFILSKSRFKFYLDETGFKNILDLLPKESLLEIDQVFAIDSLISSSVVNDVGNFHQYAMEMYVLFCKSSNHFHKANIGTLFYLYAKNIETPKNYSVNLSEILVAFDKLSANFDQHQSMLELGSLLIVIGTSLSFNCGITSDNLIGILQSLSRKTLNLVNIDLISNFFLNSLQLFVRDVICFFQGSAYTPSVSHSISDDISKNPLCSLLHFREPELLPPSLPPKYENKMPLSVWKSISLLLNDGMRYVSNLEADGLWYSNVIANFVSLSAIFPPVDASDCLFEVQLGFVNSLSSLPLKSFFDGKRCLSISRTNLLNHICIIAALLPQNAIAIGTISDDSIHLSSSSLLEVMIDLLECSYSPLVAASYSVLTRMLCFHIQNLQFQDDMDEFDFYQPEEIKESDDDSDLEDDFESTVKITDVTNKYLEEEKAKKKLPTKIFMVLPELFCQALKPVSLQSLCHNPLRHSNVLRRYFLCWSLLFDMFQTLADSSQDKLKLCIVAYLRNSFDLLLNHFVSEVIEHILVNLRDPLTSSLLQSLTTTSSQLSMEQLSAISFTHLVKPLFGKHHFPASFDQFQFFNEASDGWMLLMANALNPTVPTIHRERQFNTGTSNSLRRTRTVLRVACNENIGTEDTVYKYPQLKLFYGQLSVWLYLRVLNLIPSLARTWYNHRHHHIRNRVAKLTSDYFSSTIISKEIMSVRSYSDDANEEFRLRGSILTSEVFATYTREEIVISLKLALPSAYPLHNVEVIFTQKSGVEENLARRWLLTISGMCQASNSNLVQSLLLWQSSVDKKFAGIEECPICYSVIHASTHSLPKMPCRTCKHKFHAACLYKWFSSSAASTCPLCRSIF